MFHYIFDELRGKCGYDRYAVRQFTTLSMSSRISLHLHTSQPFIYLRCLQCVRANVSRVELISRLRAWRRSIVIEAAVPWLKLIVVAAAAAAPRGTVNERRSTWTRHTDTDTHTHTRTASDDDHREISANDRHSGQHWTDGRTDGLDKIMQTNHRRHTTSRDHPTWTPPTWRHDGLSGVASVSRCLNDVTRHREMRRVNVVVTLVMMSLSTVWKNINNWTRWLYCAVECSL